MRIINDAHFLDHIAPHYISLGLLKLLMKFIKCVLFYICVILFVKISLFIYATL